jgi:RNA polymerase sigma-70 factor (ECF subfamily)
MTDQTSLSDADFKQALAALIPHLRAFARSLTGNPTSADDLAQDAMLKAWKSREKFQAGTNMKAWAFTILRNQFYSDKRRSWRQQPLDPQVAEATLVSSDDPSDALELLALRNALTLLPDDQRDAVILVGAGGFSYDEVADICGCATGTVKSRVNRARKALASILQNNEAGYSSDVAAGAEDAFDDILQQAASLSKPVAQPA